MLLRSTLVCLMLLPVIAEAQSESGQPSSSLEEAAARSQADVVRSYGMSTLLDAQAVNQIEQARKQYIENQGKAVQTWVDASRYSNEYRRSLRPTPLSLEQYVRMAREQAPEPLTATQLDQLTGTVSWPAPLRKPEYEASRRRIDRLFQDRATGYSTYGEIPAACEGLAERLNADIQQYPPGDYVAAKKFLDSLIADAHHSQL